jgi:hypothetical protein
MEGIRCGDLTSSNSFIRNDSLIFWVVEQNNVSKCFSEIRSVVVGVDSVL